MRQVPLIFKQGDTFTKPFRRRYASGPNAGEVIDFAALGITEGQLQVRSAPYSEGGELLINLTTANGGIVLGVYDDGTGATWSGYLYVPTATMALAIPWGDARYDLKLWKPDLTWRKTIFAGPALLVPSISEV